MSDTETETIPVVPKGWALITNVTTSPIPGKDGESPTLMTLARSQLVNSSRTELQVSAHASSRTPDESIEDIEDRAVRRVLAAANQVTAESHLSVPGRSNGR
jgi:hypothetical protein